VTYRIELTPAARRDLKKLPRDVLRRVDAHILALAENPHPPGAQKLQGDEGVFRVRIGDYRIIYRVEHHRLVILVIRIGHRREVYRG
jgi:mRNA interferase RelE/StbE